MVWWLAFAEAKTYDEPKIGDWVIETTHIIGLRSAMVGRLDAIGKLIKVETETEPHLRGMKTYTIETIEGKEAIWSNAMFRKLELE